MRRITSFQYYSSRGTGPHASLTALWSLWRALCQYPPSIFAEDAPKHHMLANDSFHIAVLPGDGIGPEVMAPALAVLEKAGRDLTLDSFINAMESMKDWHDIFGGPALSLSPTNHHASNQSFLSVVKSKRWTPVTDAPMSF